MPTLTRDFYNRSPLLVAPDLLGKILVRNFQDKILSGRIVEVEAYVAFIDEAAHGFKGKTKRNASLFKHAGHAYVHRIHMQHCLDIVTEHVDVPSSVLIRALEPLEGLDLMKKFRKKENIKDLASGPGKLTQALHINMDVDGVDVTNTKSLLYVIDDGYLPQKITQGKRIGISKAKDNDFRFYIKESLYISKK